MYNHDMIYACITEGKKSLLMLQINGISETSFFRYSLAYSLYPVAAFYSIASLIFHIFLSQRFLFSFTRRFDIESFTKPTSYLLGIKLKMFCVHLRWYLLICVYVFHSLCAYFCVYLNKKR